MINLTVMTLKKIVKNIVSVIKKATIENIEWFQEDTEMLISGRKTSIHFDIHSSFDFDNAVLGYSLKKRTRCLTYYYYTKSKPTLDKNFKYPLSQSLHSKHLHLLLLDVI